MRSQRAWGGNGGSAARALPIVAMRVEGSYKSAPLGAAMVASSANRASQGKIRSYVAEISADEYLEAALARLFDPCPAAIGFSLYSWNSRKLREIARLARRAYPGIFLFAGGPEASADPTSLLGDFDTVVTGPGELLTGRIAVALASGSPLEDFFGIRSEPVALKALGSAYSEGILPIERGGGILLELARGCPFSCSYCYESKGERRLLRFPLERAKGELGLARRAGARFVQVLDPSFNASSKACLDALALFEREGQGLHFSLEARAEQLTREQARAMARIECDVQIGLQSSDPEVLRLAGRPVDMDLFKRKLALLDAEGVVFGLDLMYGLPGDNYEKFAASLDFALSLRPNHLDIFRLSVLPGTKLRDEAATLGLKHEQGPPYRLLEAPGFSAADLSRADALASRADAFYSRGRAVGWFKPVMDRLRVKPSKFLGMLPEAGQDLLTYQLQAVDEAFRAKGDDKGRLLAEDLVRLHSAMASAIVDVSSQRLDLRYDHEIVMGIASADMSAALRVARPSPARYEVSLGSDGQPVTRRLRK